MVHTFSLHGVHTKYKSDRKTFFRHILGFGEGGDIGLEIILVTKVFESCSLIRW